MRRERAFFGSRLAWTAILFLTTLGVAGYFGAWVGHRSAGLVVTGLDLAEYVKFIGGGIPGGVFSKREIFYLPLMAGSIIASLVAGRHCLPVWMRLVSFAGAIVLAFCMLPPAWTPSLLQVPEYRLQTVAIAVCLFVLLAALLARRASDRVLMPWVGLLSLLAAIWAPAYFLRLLEPISRLYGTQIRPAWGWWLSAGAFAALTCALLGRTAIVSRMRLTVRPGRESERRAG